MLFFINKSKKSKILLLFMITFAVLLISGCAVNDEESEHNEKKVEEDEEEVMHDENSRDRLSAGDVIETESGDFTLKAVKYDVLEKDVGPAITAINHVIAISGDIKGEMSQTYEQDELEYIEVGISVENTSEKDIFYDIDQTIIITDTEGQPDIEFIDQIGGRMKAGEKQSGRIIYLLEHSKAQDVSSIRIIIDQPMDEDWNIIGDAIEIEVDIS